MSRDLAQRPSPPLARGAGTFPTGIIGAHCTYSASSLSSATRCTTVAGGQTHTPHGAMPLHRRPAKGAPQRVRSPPGVITNTHIVMTCSTRPSVAAHYQAAVNLLCVLIIAQLTLVQGASRRRPTDLLNAIKSHPGSKLRGRARTQSLRTGQLHRHPKSNSTPCSPCSPRPAHRRAWQPNATSPT